MNNEFIFQMLAILDDRTKKIEEAICCTPLADFVSRKEAAEMLDVTLSTIKNYVRKGTLTPVYQGGKVFFRKSDLIKILTIKKLKTNE